QIAPGGSTATIGSGFGGVPGAGGGGGLGAPPGLGAGLGASANQPAGLLGTGGLGGANALSRPAAAAPGRPPTEDQAEAGGPSGPGGAAEPGTQGPQQIELPPMRIVADEKNNSLVVYARPRDYRLLEDALRRIDVPPLEVLIEATIAEVTLGNDLQYGLQYFFHQHENQFIFGASQTPISAAAKIAGTFPGFNYMLGSANANVVLNLLSGITNVHVISSPQLLVLDHQSASLLVGNAIPIPTAQIQST